MTHVLQGPRRQAQEQAQKACLFSIKCSHKYDFHLHAFLGSVVQFELPFARKASSCKEHLKRLRKQSADAYRGRGGEGVKHVKIALYRRDNKEKTTQD